MAWRHHTRGEKCLILHIVVTSTLIVVLAVIYTTHLLVAPHAAATARRLNDDRDKVAWGSPSPYKFGAAILLNSPKPRPVCCGVVVHASWTLTTAHCVATRNHPDLSLYLPEWRIKAGVTDLDDGGVITPIKSGIAHPNFNRDDFQNNLGLLQHKRPLTFSASISKVPIGSPSEGDLTTATAVGWALKRKDSDEYNPLALLELVQVKEHAVCESLLAPIVALRTYEYCAAVSTETDNCHPAAGAALLDRGELIGLATWGDKCLGREMPVVFTRVAPYTGWIEEVTQRNKTFSLSGSSQELYDD